jgi:hypothetical protein
MQISELVPVPINDDFGAPVFTTTGDVTALVDALQTATDNLNADITQRWFPTVSAQPAANDFVNAWIRWRDQTYAFIKGWREGWFNLAWNWYDTAASKLGELTTWRGNYEQVCGCRASGPAPNVPDNKPIDIAGIVKTVAIVAGIGGLVWIGFKIYVVSKTARALMPRTPAAATAGWTGRNYARRR